MKRDRFAKRNHPTNPNKSPVARAERPMMTTMVANTASSGAAAILAATPPPTPNSAAAGAKWGTDMVPL